MRNQQKKNQAQARQKLYMKLASSGGGSLTSAYAAMRQSEMLNPSKTKKWESLFLWLGVAFCCYQD